MNINKIGMSKSQRTPQRLFSFAMWILSLVFAGFLMGLGGLIIKDLPSVDQRVSLQQFADSDALLAADQTLEQERSRLLGIERQIEDAQQNFLSAQADYQVAQNSFDTWIATRTATESDVQNPEVLTRNREVEVLKNTERAALSIVSGAQTELREAERAVADARSSRAKVLDEAQPAYRKAKTAQELRVFLFRLAVTLPLLLIAGWMIMRKRSSSYWALYRGFSIFAIFSFFVELVPYLPSYGGYIRYVVGIITVLVSGHFLIRGMRRYLERKQAEEERSEVERRQSIDYEVALKKTASKICPGCDRKVVERDGTETDFCVHCGIRLQSKCNSCGSRNSSFHRFCLSCGAPANAMETGQDALAAD